MIEEIGEKKEFVLIFVIVNFGLGSKVLKFSKNNGVRGGTVFLGTGTIKNYLLELLDLNDSRKEIVLMLADKDTAYEVLEKINKEYHLYKPNHGIAYTIQVKDILGSKSYNCDQNKESRGAEGKMYNAIFTVVDKGNAETVIDAAAKAGSKGGTIINARGSGVHETSKLFAIEIEPEKEIVLIISEESKTAAISSSIREQMNLDKPGNGILFILDVDKAYGLFENKQP